MCAASLASSFDEGDPYRTPEVHSDWGSRMLLEGVGGAAVVVAVRMALDDDADDISSADESSCCWWRLWWPTWWR